MSYVKNGTSSAEVRLAIIGEYIASYPPHQCTNAAIAHSAQWLGMQIHYEWISTLDLNEPVQGFGQHYDAYWIAPGSPYKNMQGALDLIKFARLASIPVLGTCGGFQHMVLEFARNVAFIREGSHAEYDPYASELIVTPLSCSLVGQALPIRISDRRSLAYRAYQSDTVVEQYYCNFGLNPAFQRSLEEKGLGIVGVDQQGEARIIELPDHPFFMGTLFVPQHQSTPAKPHPLITAFLAKATETAHQRLAEPNNTSRPIAFDGTNP